MLHTGAYEFQKGKCGEWHKKGHILRGRNSLSI